MIPGIRKRKSSNQINPIASINTKHLTQYIVISQCICRASMQLELAAYSDLAAVFEAVYPEE